MILVVSGGVLMLLGLVPGLFQGLTDGIRSVDDLLSSRRPMGMPFRRESEKLVQPTWLAGLGATLIVLAMLGYFLPLA